MAKEKLSKSEIVGWAGELASKKYLLSDNELRDLADEVGLTSPRQTLVADGREVVGEKSMLFDIVTLVGSDRRLWDESGYMKENKIREFDSDFSRACVELAINLSSQEYPLIISLLLQLKHGISAIDDQSLLEIYKIVSGPWKTEAREGSLFEWRLLTLNLGLAIVLADRGYEVQLDYV